MRGSLRNPLGEPDHETRIDLALSVLTIGGLLTLALLPVVNADHGVSAWLIVGFQTAAIASFVSGILLVVEIVGHQTRTSRPTPRGFVAVGTAVACVGATIVPCIHGAKVAEATHQSGSAFVAWLAVLGCIALVTFGLFVIAYGVHEYAEHRRGAART